MKILYIHQYFNTPEEPGGTRSYWIARELIKRGHQVTMITSTHKHRPNARRVNIDGIDVIYVKNEYSNYFSSLKKIKSFISFVFKSIKVAKKEKNIDIVFATSTPLTVGGIALYLRLAKKWKYIFEVRDLWPEFPIQIGAIKNKFLIWILKKFEKTIYNKAEYIIALSPGMMDGVLKTGVSQNKVSVVPNMSKPDIFYPRKKNVSIANNYNINLNKFNIIHFGSMGVANGLQYIIDTAKVLKDRNVDDVEFIFTGDGATKPLLEKEVKNYNLQNVRFLGNFGLSELSEIVNICDASITCFKNIPILYTNSPNKLFDSLSAGKPIIVNSAGWTKDLVEKYDCGLFVNPDNAEDFAGKIKTIKNDTALLKRWGENARQLSLDIFDKDKLCKEVAQIIEKNF